MAPKPKFDQISLTPRLLAGSLFTKLCFSHDSRYLFCCCGSVIKVFNTTNGEHLHDLVGHSAMLTGIAINTNNVLQLLSCCEDGLLISWDYLDGAKLKQHNLHMPLYGIVSVDSKSDSILMIAQTSQHGHKQYGLLQWFRDKDKANEFSQPNVLIPDCNRDQEFVSFGCMNEYAASAQGSELTVYSMKKKKLRILRAKDERDREITCVACHPAEYCIATGFESGRIVFWYNFYDNQKPQTTNVHWHSLAVLCMHFSPDGSILLSGGHECVFVRWQMNNQYQKDFKPRMGAPLTRVLYAPGGNFFATLHADNVIQVMDINLTILHVHRGLSRANWNLNSSKNPIPVGLIYDPRSRAIITNGLPGHLQFYSLALQKQLYNLDVVGQNYISPESLERPTAVTEIRKAATTEDGKWLVSFEIWEDGFFTPELKLKFWEYDSSEKTYVLNTIVESPHEAEVTSMCFKPAPSSASQVNSSPLLVTTGADSCFKLWAPVDDTDIYRENTRWECQSVGFYKDMKTDCADFSCDGSSLAVGFDYLLTIWDPERNVVRTTLSDKSKQKGNIRAVKFGSDDSRYFLVSLAQNTITSWNLLSLTVEWCLQIESSIIFRDPSSDIMAFVDYNNTLIIFRPNSPEFLYTKENVSSVPVLEGVFVPNNRPADICDVAWPGRSQIYIYTCTHSLLTLDREDRIQLTEKVQIHQHLPKSSLSAIMAEKVVRDQSQTRPKETEGKTHQAEDDFISSMLHTNEPIASFCTQFLDKLLIKKKRKSKAQKVTEDETEDAELGTETAETNTEADYPSTDVIVDPALVDFLNEESEASKRNNLELDRLLSQSSDWVDWCSSLSL